MDAAIVCDHLGPSRFSLLVDCKVAQRRAVELVLVEVGYDLVAVLDERDRAAERGLWPDMADDKTHRPAGKARIRHQRDDHPPFAAERRDARGRVEHLRHAWRAAWPLVAHDDHVVVLKAAGILVERADQVLLTLEYARFASEDIVLEAALVDLGLAHHPFVLEAIVDASELQDRGEIRR